MNLEQIVTSKEISMRLRELGVPQESLFYWQRCRRSGVYKLIQRRKGEISDIAGKMGYRRYISAFTAAELGEMLLSFPYPFNLVTRFFENGVFIQLEFPTHKNGKYIEKRVAIQASLNEHEMSTLKNIPKNEADARGKMLIHLLENKLINLTK